MRGLVWAAIPLLLLLGCTGQASLEGKGMKELQALNEPIKCNVSFSEGGIHRNNGTAYINGSRYLLDFERKLVVEGKNAREIGGLDIISDNDQVLYLRYNEQEGEITAQGLLEAMTGCVGYRVEGESALEYANNITLELSNCSRGGFNGTVLEIEEERYCTVDEIREKMGVVME